MKLKSKCTALFFALLSLSTSGQMKQYQYKRNLPGIKDQWNKIILPVAIFEKTDPDLSDVRIYGITKTNDSIEAPYILQVTQEKVSNHEVAFTSINTSTNGGTYFFTFESPQQPLVNVIKAVFRNENFDWKIKVEGSQDQLAWFVITDDYRILSIKNERTNYKFTSIDFADSKFRYYRLSVKADHPPELLSAKFSEQKVTPGKFINYAITHIHTEEDKKNMINISTLSLQLPVPVSHLKIYVHDTIDYYRPTSVEYLTDSVNVGDLWQYNYSNLISGTLNSLDKKPFTFNSTLVKTIRISINNQDNKPLKIDSFVVKGYEHSLVARITQPADYFLVYGRHSVGQPQYDLERFQDKIPGALPEIIPGSEESILKEGDQNTVPFFQNKLWLWGIIILLIVILGWFSIRMIITK